MVVRNVARMGVEGGAQHCAQACRRLCAVLRVALILNCVKKTLADLYRGMDTIDWAIVVIEGRQTWREGLAQSHNNEHESFSFGTTPLGVFLKAREYLVDFEATDKAYEALSVKLVSNLLVFAYITVRGKVVLQSSAVQFGNSSSIQHPEERV